MKTVHNTQEASCRTMWLYLEDKTKILTGSWVDTCCDRVEGWENRVTGSWMDTFCVRVAEWTNLKTGSWWALL